MLAEAVIVMTVMGCGDGVVMCSPVSGPKQVWTSQSACEKAVPGVLRSSMQMPFPVIAARCHAKGDGSSPKVLIAANTNEPFKAFRVEPAVMVLRADEVPAPRNASMTEAWLSKAKSGVDIVSRSTSDGIGVLQDGTKASYGMLRDGIAVSVDATAKAARKTVDFMRDLVD